MNLVIDFGNTRIKAALFEGNTMKEQFIFNSEHELLEGLNPFGTSIENCLIGSVTKDHLRTSELLAKKFRTQVFKTDTPIPLKNLYKSALTLGSDRIAA